MSAERPATPFSLEVGFATDVGKRRERNEDSYAIYVPYPGDDNPSGLIGLLLVADGMGGERAGDRASRTAAERLRHWVSSGEYRSWDEFTGDAPLEAALRAAIQKVSLEIFRQGEDDPTIRGLGSTVVLAAVGADRVTIGHVGDSRCYRIRGGAIERLTADHSWVEKQVEAGVLTSDEARVHPQRNVLTRSLGDAIAPNPDVQTHGLQAGDVFILCSDGLTGGLEDADLERLAREHESPQILAESLVALANERDGSDNITAVVGRCHQNRDDEITEELPRTEVAAVATTPAGPGPRSGSRLPLAIFCLALGLAAGWIGQRVWAGSLLDRTLESFEQYRYDDARLGVDRLLGLLVAADRVPDLVAMIRDLEPADAPAASGPPPAPVAPALPAPEGSPEVLGDPDEAPPGDPTAATEETEGDAPVPEAGASGPEEPGAGGANDATESEDTTEESGAGAPTDDPTDSEES